MARQLNEQQYCGWCGSNVTYVSEWTSECQSCGYKRYFNPNPCSNILLVRGNSIMMVRRAIEPQKGKYDFPGGFMDMADESMEACAYRELYEEVGLSREDMTPVTYLSSAKAPTYIWQDSAVVNTCFYYSTELLDPSTTFTLDKRENTEIIWVAKEDIPGIDFAWDTDKLVLEKYFEETA